jgi:hypothetical protein
MGLQEKDYPWEILGTPTTTSLATEIKGCAFFIAQKSVKKQHFPTFYRPKNQNKTPEATYTSEQSVFEAYFATLLSNQTYLGL